MNEFSSADEGLAINYLISLFQQRRPLGQGWALDVSQELLDALVQQNPPSQVQLIRNELPIIDLPEGSVDLSWAAFVYHEMESDGLAAGW